MPRVGLGSSGNEKFKDLEYRFVLSQIKDKVKPK
jgi:hypothetical protein